MVNRFVRLVTYPEGVLPFDHVVLRDKLNPLYLHYYNAYGHQTRQGGDLPSGAPLINFHDTLIMQSSKVA